MPGEVLASLASLLSAVMGRPDVADKRLPGCWAVELDLSAGDSAITGFKCYKSFQGTHGRP